MNTRIQRIVIVVMAFFAGTAVGFAQTRMVLTNKWEGMEGIESVDLVETNVSGVETNGVSLSLSTEKTHYWVHEPVILMVALKNIDQSDVFATTSKRLILNKDLYVISPEGIGRAKETAYCRSLDELFSVSTYAVNLGPGKEHRDDSDINRLFDMTTKGEYRVFIRKKIKLFRPEREMILQTPAIIIHIDDNPSKDNQPKK
jgi:hypothetical protein